MRRPIHACLLLPLLYGPALQAAEAPPAGWSGSLDLGYTALAGNSAATSLVAAARASRTDDRLTHHLEGRARNTEEHGVRTAEAYHLAGKEDIAFGPRDYLVVHTAWDKDLFSGYDWQLTAAAGYGRKVIDSERQQLSLETGPGYRHDDLPDGDTEDTGVLRAAADYRMDLSANSRFTQLVEADIGEDSTLARALSELAVSINASLALKVSVEFRRNSQPPAGSKNSDRTTLVSLGWKF